MVKAKSKDKVLQVSKIYDLSLPKEERILDALNKIASDNKIVSLIENKGEIYVVVE